MRKCVLKCWKMWKVLNVAENNGEIMEAEKNFLVFRNFVGKKKNGEVET